MKLNYKNYKKFNTKFLKILLIIIFVLCAVNYAVNPYNIFNNNWFHINLLKPEAKIQERYTKFIGLKLDRRKLDAIFLGTSRADLALNKYYYKEITGKNAENMAMGGMIVYEYLDSFKETILIHPEIKNIYVGVDFILFDKDRTDTNKDVRYKIKEVKNITPNELGFSLLSIKSTGDSIWTIVKNILGIEKRMFNSDGTKHIFHNEEIENVFAASLREYKGYYSSYDFDYGNIEILKELKQLCEKHNINIRFFIMPSHITDLYLINKLCEKEYEKWKTALTDIGEIYDFQYPDIYNEEKINPDMKYFFESSHATSTLGNIILEGLTGNNNYGKVLTKENVKTHINEDKIKLKNYIKNNPDIIEWVDKITGD